MWCPADTTCREVPTMEQMMATTAAPVAMAARTTNRAASDANLISKRLARLRVFSRRRLGASLIAILCLSSLGLSKSSWATDFGVNYLSEVPLLRVIFENRLPEESNAIDIASVI